jgi:hypothetical protein
MPLSESYMTGSFDLFQSIDETIKAIDIKLEAIGELLYSDEKSTLDKLSGGASKIKKDTGTGSEGSDSKFMSFVKNITGFTNKKLDDSGDPNNSLISSMNDLGGKIDILTASINKANDKASGGTSGGGGGGEAVATMKELSSIGGNVGKFAVKVALAIPAFLLIKPFTGLIIETISSIVKGIPKGIKEKDVERAEMVSSSLSGIASGILKFAGIMLLATPLMLLAVPGTLLFGATVKLMGWAMTSLADKKKDIRDGSAVLNKMSLSVLAFAGSVALSAMIMSTVTSDSSLGLLALFTIAGASALVFEQVGKHSKDIKKGTISMLAVSAGLSVFALAASFASNQIEDVGIASLGMLMLGVVGIGATFALVGAYSGNMVKGALSMLAVSASLAIFGLAASFAAKEMEDVGLASLGTLVLGVLGIGTVFALAGMVWDKIALGALSMGLAGLSMMLIAPQIAALASVYEENPNALWQIPAGLLGIGTVFAMAGIPAVAPFIALGAGALGLAGLALWGIGKGVGAFMDAISGADADTGDTIESVLKGVITGFGKGFSELSVVEALTLPLKIPMVALMGGALALLGMGLGKYKSASAGWDDDDTSILGNTIGGISKAFALAGSSEGMSKLFGFNVGKNDSERGIDATMKMGNNLIKLAKGIQAWKDLSLSEEETQEISDNISRVLNFIPAIFADIGARERGSSNQMDILGVKIGVPFSSTDTELGISATKKMGSTLSNLANGIRAWKDMSLKPEEVQAIASNIEKVLGVIPALFATIGARDNGTTGDMSFFGLTFANPFSKGDTEKGIASTMEMGKNLKELADGVLAWKDFDPKSIPIIKSNIEGILTTIPSIFATIGKDDRDTEGIWWWSEGDVAKGIDLVSGMSKPLTSIAQLMNSFKDIKDPSEHGLSVGMGIKSMLQNVGEGIANIEDSSIAKLERLIKPLKKLPSIFKDVNKAMKEHTGIIGSMSEAQMNNFTKWATSLKTISDVGSTSFSKGVGVSKDITRIDDFVANNNAAQMFSPNRMTANKEFHTVEKISSPIPVKKETGVSNEEMKSLMIQMINAMNSMVTSSGAQSKELAAIKNALNTGIKIKEGFN